MQTHRTDRSNPGLSQTSRSHRVRAGESLWAIAQQTLGDGNRWHEIFALNRGVIADPDRIQPGMVLRLPGNAQAHEASTHRSRPRAGGQPRESRKRQPERTTQGVHRLDVLIRQPQPATPLVPLVPIAPEPPAVPAKPAPKPRPHHLTLKDLPRHLNINYGGAGGAEMKGVNMNATGATRASYAAAKNHDRILGDLVKTGDWFRPDGSLKYSAHQLADIISKPYTLTLRGKRPGGADAVVLDEINDRLNVAPKTFAEALRLVKKRYPDRPLLLYMSHPNNLDPTLLRAASKYGDRVLVEMYKWESQYPGGNVSSSAFDEFLRPIQHVAPGILNKTIPVLGVDQRPGPYDFDNSSSVNFKHFLNQQVHALKNHPLLKHMAGIANYPSYGASDDVKNDFGKLARWYVNTNHHHTMQG